MLWSSICQALFCGYFDLFLFPLICSCSTTAVVPTFRRRYYAEPSRKVMKALQTSKGLRMSVWASSQNNYFSFKDHRLCARGESESKQRNNSAEEEEAKNRGWSGSGAIGEWDMGKRRGFTLYWTNQSLSLNWGGAAWVTNPSQGWFVKRTIYKSAYFWSPVWTSFPSSHSCRFAFAYDLDMRHCLVAWTGWMSLHQET